MQKKASLASIFALLSLLVASCVSGPPVQEMSDARQAISAAVEAGADRLAPVEIDAARRYLQEAEDNLKTRSFNTARSDAVRAKQKAVEALEASHSAAEGG